MNKKIFIPMILLLVLLLVSHFNITGWAIRSISSSQDNKETMIRNSNGKYWQPTGANLQIAIDDTAVSGGSVWLPAGTIVLPNPQLDMKSNVHLMGKGRGITVLQTCNGCSAGIEAYGQSNFTISDLTINGNRHNGGLGNGIQVRGGSSDFIIDNIQISSAQSNALFISGAEKGFVSNYKANDIGEFHGLALNNVNESVFSDVMTYDIDDGYAVNLHTVHNCGFNNFVTESYWGVKMVDYQSSNNNFNNFQIRLINNSEGHQGLKLNRIDSSNFNNIKISGSYKGIACSTNCYNNNFNNIIIEQPNAYGIHLDGGHDLNFKNIKILEPESYGITISGSSENVSFDSMLIKNASYGFRLDGPEDIKLSNTVIANSSIYGVYLNGVSDVQVTRSVIKNSGTRGIHVSDNGDSSDYLISDCIIDGTPNQGIYIADVQSSNFIVTNNVLVNTGSGIQNDSTGANQLITDNLT